MLSIVPVADFSAEPAFTPDQLAALRALYRFRDECYDLEGPVGQQVRFALERLIGAVGDGSRRIVVSA